MKRAALILDRDGTLLKEPLPSRQIDSLEKFELIPGVVSGLKEVITSCDFDLYMVTNQDGLGTSSFPEDTFTPFQNLLLAILSGEGMKFKAILIDNQFGETGKPGGLFDTRKPGIGLITPYLENIDCERSFVVGDRETDMLFAKNLGIRGLYLGDQPPASADYSANSWSDMASFIIRNGKLNSMVRRSNETSVSVSILPWGRGRTQIETGIGFFDHMLSLLFFYAKMDVSLSATGDLFVDEHHTVEDVALVIGQVVDSALDSRRGIRRFGFTAPMDESLCTCAVDLSGRAELVWDVKFTREKIGELPTEMIKHFFKSLAIASRSTLHISAKGENEHHIAESIFKCVGLALRDALRFDPLAGVPSTKGLL